MLDWTQSAGAVPAMEVVQMERWQERIGRLVPSESVAWWAANASARPVLEAEVVRLFGPESALQARLVRLGLWGRSEARG